MSQLNDLLNGKQTQQKQAAPSQEKSNKVVNLDSLFDAEKTEQKVANLLETNLTLTTEIGDWQGKELPTDAPELAKSLQDSLAHLQKALKAGDVTTALYDTKMFIDNNPATKDLLHPEDINLFIKALQSSHSVVIVKKATRKATKSATNQAAEALAAELGDLGL